MPGPATSILQLPPVLARGGSDGRWRRVCQVPDCTGQSHSEGSKSLFKGLSE